MQGFPYQNLSYLGACTFCFCFLFCLQSWPCALMFSAPSPVLHVPAMPATATPLLASKDIFCKQSRCGVHCAFKTPACPLRAPPTPPTLHTARKQERTDAPRRRPTSFAPPGRFGRVDCGSCPLRSISPKREQQQQQQVVTGPPCQPPPLLAKAALCGVGIVQFCSEHQQQRRPVD